jgi:hypothetical protein
MTFDNLQQATDYTIQAMEQVAPHVLLDEDEVEIVLGEMFLEHLEGEVPPETKEHLEEKIEDVDYLQAYLRQHAPNFHTALEEAVIDFLTPYLIQQEVNDVI